MYKGNMGGDAALAVSFTMSLPQEILWDIFKLCLISQIERQYVMGDYERSDSDTLGALCNTSHGVRLLLVDVASAVFNEDKNDAM